MNKLSKQDMEARIAEYRKEYPQRTLYFTEDGNCFLEKSPCVDYANKSKQKWFETASEVKVEKELNTDRTPEQIKEVVLSTDITDDMDYQLAKEIVKVLNLESKSNKKDDLLVAIEEYKLTLSKPTE